MKEHILEVHTTMTSSSNFAKNQVFFIVARMVYIEVALGVQIDWRTNLGGRRGKVPLYQTKAIQAHL